MSSNLPMASTKPKSRAARKLVDDRIREILVTGESVVRDNADRLTSCLILATEERS